MRKVILIIFLNLIIYSISFAQIESADYFGIEKPGIIARKFNPSILELEGSFIAFARATTCRLIPVFDP